MMYSIQAQISGQFSLLRSRYGGISVGGELPVLAVEPKAIQGVAAQLGRLLNVTGVRSGDWVAFCLFVSSASFAGDFTSRPV